jgi:hypothetical protein
MISLLYLKHAFNESDEGVVERWGETPTWQFFQAGGILSTVSRATPAPWSNSASCLVKGLFGPNTGIKGVRSRSVFGLVLARNE